MFELVTFYMYKMYMFVILGQWPILPVEINFETLKHTSLEQNTPQTSAYRNFYRYASDTPLICEYVTEALLKIFILTILKIFVYCLAMFS